MSLRALLLAVCCLSALFCIAKAAETVQYGIMIDAGSTGSRLHIYQWDRRTANTVPGINESPVNQTNPFVTKETPGIASFAVNGTHIRPGLGDYLKKLINYAKEKIPATAHNSTPIYLFATAGMRLLNETEQAGILAVIRNVMSNTTTNPFLFSPSNVRVIPGEDEGFYGWLSVNYLEDPTFTKPSIGALDLGGASTQITFLSTDMSIPKGNKRVFELAEKHYSVYVASFLHFGIDQARDQIYNALIPAAANKTFTSPCYPTGKKGEYMDYTVEGGSDFAGCQADIGKIIDTSACLYGPSNCSFNGMYMPALNGSFVAMSGYYYTMDFFNLSKGNLADLKTAATAYCGLTWEQMQAKYGTTNMYLDEYCFDAIYVMTLLEKGFKFTENFGSHPIKFQDNYTFSGRSTDVSWALGAMLFEANLIPYKAEPKWGNYVGLVFGVLALITVVVIIIVCVRKQKKAPYAQV